MMNDDVRHNPWQASDDEYKAYTALELAKNTTVPLETIFKGLGRYEQAVVDVRSAARKKNKASLVK